nr:hypothetical protein [Saprospiraceae bacterium]
RGNIKESMAHGRQITQNIIEGYIADAEGAAVEEKNQAIIDRIASAISSIDQEVRNNPVSETDLGRIMSWVQSRQTTAGYTGSFADWAEANKPVRLEDLIGGH